MKPNVPFVSRRGAVLLGGAHGTLEIARSLGRRGISVWLVTADNPLAGLSRYVERSVSWPGPDADDAARILIDRGRRSGLDGWVLFPGSDEDLRFVACNHAALGYAFTLVTPPWETARWAYDKRLMNARAAELGIAQPLTRYPRCGDDPTAAWTGLSFPTLLKPTVRTTRNAFVDAKAWRVDDAAALQARYQAAQALVGAERVMIQELIPGDGSTQFSYAGVWHRGRPIGVLTARRLRQYPTDFGFTSTLVETVDAPDVEAAATRFLQSLSFTGLVEIEFKYDGRDGSYKILDVNARAWTWLALGAAAGVDFPMLQWRLAAGEAVAPVRARPGARWRYLSRDVAASLAELAGGTLPPLAYLRSLRPAAAAAVFAWDDLRPALLDLPVTVVRVLTRRLTRRRGAVSASGALPPRPAGTMSASPR